MGRITEGVGRRTAPAKSSTAEGAEDLEPLWSDESLGRVWRVDPIRSFCFFIFFLSSLASVSASHAAFTRPRDAFLLLVHSAESSSPAICAMVFLLMTDVSYL